MPVEVMSTIRPLPGIRLCRPWHIDVAQLIVTVTGPPCTLRVGEVITMSFNWRRAITYWRFAGDTDGLVDVDKIGVRNVIVGGKTLPGYLVVSAYPS